MEKDCPTKSSNKSSALTGSDLASQVGKRIRDMRKQKHLSLESLSKQCHMNPAYIGHIERGVQNPTLNTLERICKGLDISAADLFKDKNSTADMNSATMHYLAQITSDLSPEQFYRLLNIIKDIIKLIK